MSQPHDSGTPSGVPSCSQAASHGRAYAWLFTMLADHRIDRTAFAVYCYLSMLRDGHGEAIVFPSRETIARRIGLSPKSKRTVSDALGRLERAGLIQRHPWFADNAQTTNRYVLRDFPPRSSRGTQTGEDIYTGVDQRLSADLHPDAHALVSAGAHSDSELWTSNQGDGRRSSQGTPLERCLTPDGRHVISLSASPSETCWECPTTVGTILALGQRGGDYIGTFVESKEALLEFWAEQP